MRRAKAFDVKKEIARQLHISELDYIPAVQDRLTDPEMCNYQVVIQPREADTDSQIDNPHEASIPDDVTKTLDEEYPDINIKSVFGEPHSDAEKCLHFVLNDGVEYEVKNLHDRTRKKFSFTEKMEKLTKAIRKKKLDEHLLGPWLYVNCPPHPSVYSRKKPFRAVQHYPGVGRHEEDLEVFQPSNVIEFLRIPEPIEEEEEVRLGRGQVTSIHTSVGKDDRTDWTGNVNYVSVTSGKIDQPQYRYNGDLNEPEYPDTGYYLSGAFANPTITEDIDTILPEIYEAMTRTTAAVRLNTEVEQVWANSELPTSDNLSSLSDEEISEAVKEIELKHQQIPIREVHQVGEKTIAKIARAFGTYHSLAEATPKDVENTSQISTGRFNSRELISTAQTAVKAHRVWRQVTDTGSDKVDIGDLIQYPRDHPKLSIHSSEAGRPEQSSSTLV